MRHITSKICLVVFSFSVAVSAFGSYVYAAKSPADTAPGSSLEQRIAQRKKERGIKLNTNSKSRLQSQCTFTQGKLRTISDSYNTSSDSRDKVYRSIDAKLWVIIGSLKLINKDTFKLEQQRTEYAKRIQAFENQSSEFRQSINDIMAMNCKADPVGFMALVGTARLYNAQVRSSFISIKSYLVDQIQPTITQQANDLKLKTSTE